ncbi:hypothetical protein VDF70_10605 [Xanthomonas campestris pv. raphani]|uniref:hypothetical protein n=1 Tax=Xanthomonas campestris TaxID=339 RepID=UPI002B230111|nr:hypothetical protein [Xanthomonas campestris]MEA9708449.1 hypothetical protein [Xanthomonas campestris pv. raphani]MEA9759510.1 hypothetical protein [Xanthomonas campestris pv. raphani]
MNQSIRRLEGLRTASLNAERAFKAATSTNNAHYPEVQRHTWAAAAILHCDILRYIVTFENSTTEGLVRLLWMGDIVSMLYEARIWFQKTGNTNLQNIASSSGADVSALKAKIKALRKRYPLNGIEAFADFRNKVGHHYDPSFVAHLHTFSEMDSRAFYSALTNYANFSGEWVVLCKEVIKQASGEY